MGNKAGILVLLILIITLAVRFSFSLAEQPKLQNGQEIRFETRLTEEPQIINGRQQFRVNLEKGQRVRITTGLTPLLKYGDRIEVIGKVKSNVYNGHTFFTINFPDLQISDTDHNFITRSANSIRRKAEDVYRNNLPPVSASLLTGIVFGGDQGMPKAFLEDLRVSGVVHVIAASGMNVTFVAGALIGVLGAFFKRQIAITIAIFGVMFYAFISGFEPSIVRASIMSIIAFSASLLGRQNFALSSLLITAFGMLFHSPVLISDVGFQLSFLATAGILLVKPLLATLFGKLGWLGNIGSEDLGTTIAAQIATLPILLGTFGNYGMLSVLVNAIVLWTVPVLMILGSLGLIAGAIFEPLGAIFLLPAVPILYFFEKTVTVFGNIGWSVTIPSVSSAIWIGYYLILTAVIISVRKRVQNQNKK